MKLFLLLFIIISISNFAQINSSLIEKGKKYLLSVDTVYYPEYCHIALHQLKKMSMKDASQYYAFDKEIQTPFLNTKFFLYHFLNINPSPYFVVAIYNDTLKLLDRNCHGNYGCKSLIDFLNKRLQAEQPLGANDLLSLLKSYGELNHPSYFPYKIISKYSDVWWKGNNRKINYPPDRLKMIIRPISIKYTTNGFRAKYFVWDTSELSKVNFLYKNNKLYFDVKLIGVYTHPGLQ